MNKSEFINHLEEPNKLGASQIEDIQSLVQDYPYFQSAHLLLTKAFHQSENFNFENQLRKTAAYAANRKVLHELLFSESIQEEPDQNIIEEPNPTETTEDIVPEASETEEELNSNTIEESVPENKEIKSEEPEEIKENEETVESDITEKKKETESNELEQQILTSAINSSILLEVSDEIDLNDFPVSTAKATEQEVEVVEPYKEQQFDESESHSFSGWLSHFKDEEPEKPLWDSEEETQRIKILVENQSNLPQKHEFYSPSKMAKLSVQENDDLVTETLANIYADQGNFEKAIKSFEKLQLKYPEKKIYFAGRIKKIENQLNSQ